MADDLRIEVKGLRDLQRGLRELDKAAPKELAASLMRGAEIVSERVQTLVPRVSGRAAASVKPRKDQRGASIATGGRRAPYYPWLDFGGRVGRRKSVVRPFMKEGRYVYPSLKEKRKEVMAVVDKAISEAAARIGYTEQKRG